MSLDLNSTFKIAREHNLGGEDYHVLSQLYLPIMGIDSFSLYMYLFSLKDNESYFFKKVVDALNLNTPKFLERAFSKLEALSLIKLFYNEQKGYYINLYTPVCKYSFFENSILANFLYEQIGEMEFTKLSKDVFTNPRGYKEITKSFDDVFEFKDQNIESLFTKIIRLKTKPDIKIENPNFDYLFFKMNFDTEFLDSKILDDEEFKNQILAISYNYQLNEEEMKEVIMNTIEIDKDLTYQDISKNARKYFQKKNRNTKRVVVTKEPDAFITSALDDEHYSFISKIEKMDPVTLLKNVNGNIAPSTAEIKMIEDLQRNTNFPQSVINIMILMVNYLHEGVLPGYSYFEKIANTWARAGVKTPVDALLYLEKQNEKRNEKQTNNKTYNRKQKVSPVPDWYQGYKKQLENLPKREKMSDEELEEIIEDIDKVL